MSYDRGSSHVSICKNSLPWVPPLSDERVGWSRQHRRFIGYGRSKTSQREKSLCLTVRIRTVSQGFRAFGGEGGGQGLEGTDHPREGSPLMETIKGSGGEEVEVPWRVTGENAVPRLRLPTISYLSFKSTNRKGHWIIFQGFGWVNSSKGGRLLVEAPL